MHLQNHDRIGNRAAGERLAHLGGLPCAKVGAALLLTAPFVPLIFQGEKWAASSPFLYFTDHDDPGLAEAVARGRRDEFAAWGWDPDLVLASDPGTGLPGRQLGLPPRSVGIVRAGDVRGGW